MSRNDTPPNACHAHLSAAGDSDALRPEGKDIETTGRGHGAGDHLEGGALNWEAAWIDLGGEG
jgi:hypothetical protein